MKSPISCRFAPPTIANSTPQKWLPVGLLFGDCVDVGVNIHENRAFNLPVDISWFGCIAFGQPAYPEAERRGLVNRFVEPVEVVSSCETLAELIALMIKYPQPVQYP